ncbi:MAG: hypothetical protein AAF108_03475 [Planctomycetota bacterium]
MTRTAVLAGLASLMIVAGVAVIGLQATRGGSDTDEPEAPEPEAAAAETGPSGPNAMGPASAARIRLVDRRDPTRIAWDIEVDAFDPVPGTDRVRITSPRGWVYLDPESPTYFSAASGEFTLAELGQEPDRGRLEGDVDIRVFEGPLDGVASSASELPSPEGLNPAATVRSESLSFDSLRGRLVSETPITIDAGAVHAEFGDLAVLISPEAARVEEASSDTPGLIVFDAERVGGPNAARTPAAREAAPARAAPVAFRPAFRAQPAASGPSPTTEPVDQPPLYYTTAFRGDVALVQGPASIQSERMRAYATVVDGRLPDDAIEPLSAAPSVLPVPPGRSLIEQVAWNVVAAQPGPAGGPPTDAPVRLTWTTSMRLFRTPEAQAAMLPDSLAAVFDATDGVPVVFAESGASVSGVASEVRYGLSTATVSAKGTVAFPLVVDADGSGRLAAADLAVDLGTGVGVIRGPGSLTARAQPRSQPRAQDQNPAEEQPTRPAPPTAATDDRIDWTERVDFLLTTGGDRQLEEATFAGDVRLISERLEASGDRLRAVFGASGETGSFDLRGATLNGSVKADARDASMTADEIDIGFDPSAAEPTPDRLTATGRVVASQRGAIVRGDLLEARLEPGPDGEAEVTTSLVEGNAEFRRDDGTFAAGDTIRNDTRGKRTEVLGSPAVVGSPGGRITGPTVVLEEEGGRVSVAGAGEFEREADGRVVARATWTDSMRYASEAGRLEAFGDVAAVSTPDETGRDTIRAQRLFATLVEGPGGETALSDLRAFGSDGSPASVETLRFDADNAADQGAADRAGVPERLIYLEGPVILADNPAATLTVDGPGRLVTADNRSDEAPDAEGAGQSGASGGGNGSSSQARGAALFDWQRDLLFDRRVGTLRMRRGVRMVRQSASRDEAENTEILAERLTARLTASTAGSARAGDRAQPLDPDATLFESAGETTIREVVAEGAVWARRGPTEVIGDRLVYDAAGQSARVESPASGLVSAFNRETGTDVTATAIEWDLINNRVDLIDPTPVAAPR